MIDTQYHSPTLCLFQNSEWKWSDVSSASYIDWGLSHLHPHISRVLKEGKTCEYCVNNNTSQGIHKISITQLPLSCSAFEISQDYSHVSMFPVNCTAKYWSRVICEDRSVNMNKRHKTKTGYGEYWSKHLGTFQRKYICCMCPVEFNFVVEGYCLRLILIENDLIGYQGKKVFFDSFTYNKFNISICKDNNGAFASLYKHIIADIVEEFFPEGSDFFQGRHAYSGYWLPNYPSYIACFEFRRSFTAPTVSNVSIYTCEDGSVIADIQVCNGVGDCSNAGDEQNCSLCSWTDPLLPDCKCNIKFYYQCESGGCVHYDQMCDSMVDCPGGDDETFCYNKNRFPYFDNILISKSFITDLCDPPSGDMLMCRTKLQCYSSSAICHYDHSGGEMAHCEDGSHIGSGSLCQFVECRQQYKCQMSYCIPSRKVCDGVIDCPAGDDEAICTAFRCPGHMPCYGVTYCVPPHEVCDGISHCPQQDDEKYCQICPQNCNCKGSAIYCYNVTASLPTQNLYSPSALVLFKSFNFFLELFNQSHSIMNHAILVNLNYGSFSSLLENQDNISMHFLSVKFLYLNHQGLYTLPCQFINGPLMIYVNLSHNSIQSVNENAFSLMKNVKTLSLVSNKLNSLEPHYFRDLSDLTSLYLRDNPLIYIANSVFLTNPGLVIIRSDWYMVCCVAIHAKDCTPQNQFVSSCSNLISSTATRVVLMTQGIIVVVGNTGALVAQFTLIHITPAEKYLIVSLIFADMLMGLYLLAIETVDLMYNMVFHKIVSEWTTSVPCGVFGLVNFISSEVSLLMLNILAFARMISIEKVGGMALLKSRVKIACFSAWAVIVATGIAYVVSLLLLQNMGARNNLCILLGISHLGNITLLEQVFQGVFISINMMLLLAMMTSMICIFQIVHRSYRRIIKASGQRVKAQEARMIHTGLKLLLLLACNYLTWLPFLLISILLLCGIPVGEVVLQWVIVLAVPICASTDPILYNLSSLRAQMKKK